MKAIYYIAGTVALLSCGCVSSQRHPPHAAWPAPVTASNLGEFEGVFRNDSFDSQTGKAVENANELFVFLLGPAHAHENRGDRVEIRATADGNQLKVCLLDRQNDEVDAATLQRGTGFEFSDGGLILHGPFTGLGDLNSNLGPGAKLARKRLHLSATGDLLGSASEDSAMLVMMFIPGVSTMKFWLFWPKLAK